VCERKLNPFAKFPQPQELRKSEPSVEQCCASKPRGENQIHFVPMFAAQVDFDAQNERDAFSELLSIAVPSDEEYRYRRLTTARGCP
jgi:hypothetical protein